MKVEKEIGSRPESTTPNERATFKESIDSRQELWHEIIAASEITDTEKEECRKTMDDFITGWDTQWESISDAFYYTKNRLYTALLQKERGADKPEYQALFENLRDDLIELESELK